MKKILKFFKMGENLNMLPENKRIKKDDIFILFTGLNTRLSLFCKKLYRMEETSLPR